MLAGRPGPNRIRLIFQDLGGGFVKLGQILALRSDMVSEALAWELLNLLDDMPTIPAQSIKKIIERELGRSPSEVFLRFDDEPVASASFGQVHKAVTFDGRVVAIKVQRSGIERTLRCDLRIIYLLARAADLFVLFGSMSAAAFAAEFSKWTLAETDYIREGRDAEALAEQEKDGKANFPKVFWKYTTGKILTEDFMSGPSLKTIFARQLPVASRDELSRNLIASTMHQYFVGGRFHADPHAGNILVGPDNRLAYVDFGIVGENDLPHRAAMAMFVRYSMMRDYDRAVTAFLHLGLVNRFARDLRHLLSDHEFMGQFTSVVEVFKKIIVKKFAKIVESWREATNDPHARFTEKSAAKTFFMFLQMAEFYNVVVDPEIVLFIKTLVAVDALSLRINPAFNLADTINEVFSQSSYQALFSPSSLAAVDRPLAELAVKKRTDEDYAQKLKDYYEDWFLKIYQRHEKEFAVVALKATKSEEIKKPAEIVDGVPEWIVAMREGVKTP